MILKSKIVDNDKEKILFMYSKGTKVWIKSYLKVLINDSTVANI